MSTIEAAGTFTLGERRVKRLGYGAMQLAGPHVYGPPRDPDAARAVLREAIAQGVDHIDTSDYYGPHVTNGPDSRNPFALLRRSGHRYQDWRARGSDASWLPAYPASDLAQAVEDNRRNLGVDMIEVVNLRIMFGMEPVEGSIEAPLTALAEMQSRGLVRHVGLSNVTMAQVAEGRSDHPHRLRAEPIQPSASGGRYPRRRTRPRRHCLCAVLPSWRLQPTAVHRFVGGGGATRCDADASCPGLAAASLAQYPADPRHSSVAHLKENLAAGEVELSEYDMDWLNSIAATATYV